MLLVAAVLAGAGPLAAQAPSPPAPGTRHLTLAVGPAGQATIRKYLGTPDPAIVQRVAALRAVGQQMAALADAPRLDLPRLQALMRQQETLQGDIQRLGNDRTVTMLRELSEADRIAFVRGVRDGQRAAAVPAPK